MAKPSDFTAHFSQMYYDAVVERLTPVAGWRANPLAVLKERDARQADDEDVGISIRAQGSAKVAYVGDSAGC
jgi:hypothetical protein